MKIALDYDSTYTADPDLWNAFIALAEAQGHTIHIVTWRYKDFREEICEPNIKIPIIYTAREAKQKFGEYDIWIDDNPWTILHDHTEERFVHHMVMEHRE